jgi:hypothetical protein
MRGAADEIRDLIRGELQIRDKIIIRRKHFVLLEKRHIFFFFYGSLSDIHSPVLLYISS